jgi:hypothetical protein
MLSSGNTTSKTCDWTRRNSVFLTSVPSTVTDRALTASMGLIAARSCAAVKLWLPYPHALGELKKERFVTGKKSDLSSGTEHVRVADPPKKVPAKNHTKSRCPTIQFSPVLSKRGFTDFGIDKAHCHQSAVSADKWPGGKVSGSADAGFTGIISPTTIPTIAKTLLLRFMAYPLLSR